MNQLTNQIKNVILILSAILIVALLVYSYVLKGKCFSLEDQLNNSQSIHEQKYQKLSDELSIAESMTITKQQMLDDKMNQVSLLLRDKQSLKKELEKLKQSGFTVNQIESGGVTVNTTNIVEGSGTRNRYVMDVNIFEDDWQTSILIPPSKIQNNYHFKIGDVSFSLEDKNSNKIQIYSIWLESLTTGKRMQLDYKKDIVSIKKEEKYSFYWWNPKVSTDILFGSNKGVESSLDFSFCSYGKSTDNKDTSVLFPFVGLSSNFRDSIHLGIGAKTNISGFIPLLTDLYISARYATLIDDLSQKSILFGIGTSL
jgi:hypothetical protein